MYVPYPQALWSLYCKVFLMRKSVVNAFTPSAMATVLLCSAENRDTVQDPMYAALRRHLSTSHNDRHYNGVHSWGERFMEVDVCELLSNVLLSCLKPAFPCC